MLQVRWEPASGSLFSDKFHVVDVCFNLQSATQVLGWVGQVNNSRKLSVTSVKRIKVPPELL